MESPALPNPSVFTISKNDELAELVETNILAATRFCNPASEPVASELAHLLKFVRLSVNLKSPKLQPIHTVLFIVNASLNAFIPYPTIL